MNNKSKLAAALLAFFLGTIGAHRYYLGHVKTAVVQTLGFIATIAGYIILPISIETDLQSLFFLSIALLILGGLILLTLGLIGEYIGRIYMCMNTSPQFVIRPPGEDEN